MNRTAARVLLTEDDHDMRALIAAKLRLDGHDVIDVADGGRMLVCIANAYVDSRAYDAFDLIVSDIRMPVCSGLAILEGLRKAHWPTKVILMTAFGDETTRNKALKLGAVLFDKPFDVDDLRTAVHHLLTHDSDRGLDAGEADKAGEAHESQRSSRR